jgi:hypothetical protein
MLSTLWQKWLNRPPQPCRRRPAAPQRCRPRLEVLEDRLAPAVLTVNTTSDGNDPSVLSLRQAIQAVDSQSLANLSPQQQVSGILGDNDQIQFAPGLTGTIQLTQGELDITQPVRIDGPGASNLTIDAQGQSRIFAIPTPDINVTLDGLTITRGMDSILSDFVGGGGIVNCGALTVSNCILSGNSAAEATGGGIENVDGQQQHPLRQLRRRQRRRHRELRLAAHGQQQHPLRQLRRRQRRRAVQLELVGRERTREADERDGDG